jgi:hypothetical protein
MSTLESVLDRDYLESLIDENIAAKFLGCSQRTLQHWRLRGGGPPFVRKSKRFVRYRRQDLIAWASGGMATSTSSPAHGDATRSNLAANS